MVEQVGLVGDHGGRGEHGGDLVRHDVAGPAQDVDLSGRGEGFRHGGDGDGRVDLVGGDGGDHVGDLLHRAEGDGFEVETFGAGDAADHVVERRSVLGDRDAVAWEFFDGGQTLVESLVGGDDGGAFVAFFLMQGAADDFQGAFLGEVEEASGQGGDTYVDVSRDGGGGDWLGGFEEAEGEVDALVSEVAAFLGDVERGGGEGVEEA